MTRIFLATFEVFKVLRVENTDFWDLASFTVKSVKSLALLAVISYSLKFNTGFRAENLSSSSNPIKVMSSDFIHPRYENRSRTINFAVVQTYWRVVRTYYFHGKCRSSALKIKKTSTPETSVKMFQNLWRHLRRWREYLCLIAKSSRFCLSASTMLQSEGEVCRRQECESVLINLCAGDRSVSVLINLCAGDRSVSVLIHLCAGDRSVSLCS